MQATSLIVPMAQVPTDVLTSPAAGFEARIRAAQSAAGEKQKDELKKVSREFEAIFIAQLLKVMRETIEESGLMNGGFGKSIYTELFDQEVSLEIARRGALGISDLLYKNLLQDNQASGPGAVEETAPGNQPQSPATGDRESAEEISDLQLPVRAPISSGFGLRKDPFSQQVRFHKGLDLAAPEGTRVVAALPGRVVSAEYQSGYGNTVLMQHPGGLQTRYGHLGSMAVKAGDVIESEAVLGTVGSTGRSTGPHLHFEVIRTGEPVDPLRGAQVSSLSTRVHN